MSLRLTRPEFLAWAEAQPRGRFERVDGEVVAMAPERWAHARIKGQVFEALRREIRGAGLPCQVAPDGMTVHIGEDTDYEPDCLVNCGPPIPDESISAPDPVIIVEVLSPSATKVDTGAKLADYFRLPSVQHYLLVHATRREIIHHRRTEDSILTRIVHEGTIQLEPPGIHLSLDEVYAA